MVLLFVNDYSFHGQFSTPPDVIEGVRRLWDLRKICQEYSAEVFCSRFFLGKRLVIPGVTFREVVIDYPKPDIRRLILSWLDKNGPFWDKTRLHDAGEWYFVMCGVDEQLVTDSAVAECTARVLQNERAGLLSVTPSDFTFTPIAAGTRNDVSVARECKLKNYWEENPLREFLKTSISVDSWMKLRDHAIQRFQFLIFSRDAFTYLDATPFSIGMRDRILERLATLNSISGEMDKQTGELNAHGQFFMISFLLEKRLSLQIPQTQKKEPSLQGSRFSAPFVARKPCSHGTERLKWEVSIVFILPGRNLISHVDYQWFTLAQKLPNDEGFHPMCVMTCVDRNYFQYVQQVSQG